MQRKKWRMSPRDEYIARLATPEGIANQIDQVVPITNLHLVDFRAELAGLLVVSIVASYENCVKDTLMAHANMHNARFGEYVERTYSKLNSRVRVNDLRKYIQNFAPEKEDAFKNALNAKRKRISDWTGRNIETCFEQLQNWRHDYAHSGAKKTTIEEALKYHRFAKHVMLVFWDVLV